MCSIFVVSHQRRRFFNAELFPNYGIFYSMTEVASYLATHNNTSHGMRIDAHTQKAYHS